MKKMIAFAILFAAAFAVQAQTSCKTPDAKYIHAGSVGQNFYVYGWCDDTKFWWGYLIVADMTAKRVEADTAFWLGAAVAADLKPTRPDDDPIVAELWAAAWNAMQADTARPPKVDAPVETVAKNGAYTTRPAYPVIDGQIGTKEAARATIGEPCGCSTLKIVRGSVTYCAAPKPNAALVTVCREP